jgi:hypothetical protein
MFRRENLIGLLLLLFCSVSAAVMIRAIITGVTPQVDLPPAVAWPLGILFVGLLLYGVFTSFRDRRSGGDGPAWPDPRSGQRSLWDRIRGRNKNDRM